MVDKNQLKVKGVVFVAFSGVDKTLDWSAGSKLIKNWNSEKPFFCDQSAEWKAMCSEHCDLFGFGYAQFERDE